MSAEQEDTGSMANSTLGNMTRAMTIDVTGLDQYLSSQATRAALHLHQTRSAGSMPVASNEPMPLKSKQFRDHAGEDGASGLGMLSIGEEVAPNSSADLNAPVTSPFSSADKEAGHVVTFHASSHAEDGSGDRQQGQAGHAGPAGLGPLSITLSTLNSTMTLLPPGCPPHGVKAVCGKRSKMEDTYVVQNHFFDLPSSVEDESENSLPPRIRPAIEEGLGSGTATMLMSTAPAAVSMLMQQHAAAMQDLHGPGHHSGAHALLHDKDTLHFFGIYDGHGGIEAANHCAARLHQHLIDALEMIAQGLEPIIPELSISGPLCSTVLPPACSGELVDSLDSPSPDAEAASSGQQPAEASSADAAPPQQAAPAEQAPPAACSASRGADLPPPAAAFTPPPLTPPAAAGDDGAPLEDAARDEEDPGAPTPMPRLSSTGHSSCHFQASPFATQAISSSSTVIQHALRAAFLKTDAEFAHEDTAAMVGSTAVVALLGTRKMWIANAGDSRAVLCRNGKVVQLTDDHKPEREDEAARVEKAGGQVLYWNGHRVMGVLAMSRAIGDHGLRPYVIPEPEITVVSRHDDDEILLLASDGLWDVMANQEATNLAMRCMTRAWEKGASRKAAVRIAASVLTKAAIDRGSKDNVTVIIVDLKTNPLPAVPATVKEGEGGEEGASTPVGGATPSTAAEAAAAEPAPESAASGGGFGTAASSSSEDPQRLDPPEPAPSFGGFGAAGAFGGFAASAASPGFSSEASDPAAPAASGFASAESGGFGFAAASGFAVSGFAAPSGFAGSGFAAAASEAPASGFAAPSGFAGSGFAPAASEAPAASASGFAAAAAVAAATEEPPGNGSGPSEPSPQGGASSGTLMDSQGGQKLGGGS